jgi:hypothetical protein
MPDIGVSRRVCGVPFECGEGRRFAASISVDCPISVKHLLSVSSGLSPKASPMTTSASNSNFQAAVTSSTNSAAAARLPAGVTEATPGQVRDVIKQWVEARLPADVRNWVEDRCQVVAAGDRKALYLSFGMASRKAGKADLQLAPAELELAARLRTGWQPLDWSVDQAVRTLLVLSLPATDPAELTRTLDPMFWAGEVRELVALYQALPLLPHPSAHGIRSNIQSVFTAVAHRNPYPAEQLPEERWNQLVLKCLFVGVPLDPVYGLDQRANATLATIMGDYAHERWAAGRPITPELWRCVGPFAQGSLLADLERVLKTGGPLERLAAGLALSASPEPAARSLLAAEPALASQLAGLSWSSLAARLAESASAP